MISNHTSARFVLVLCCLVAFAGLTVAAAEDEKPKTLGKKTTATTTKSTGKSSSLASAAANIKLKHTDESGKKTTISNQNLGELSKGGVVSSGGGVTGAPDPDPLAMGSSAPKPASESRQLEYENQRLKVDALERSLKDWEKEVAKNDPKFANTTQNRSPGVRSPDDLTRESVTAELEAERKTLAAMKQKAEKDGVRLDPPKK